MISTTQRLHDFLQLDGERSPLYLSDRLKCQKKQRLCPGSSDDTYSNRVQVR